MDWFDIGGTGRVNVITEQEYRGIMCKYVDGKGWKIVFGMHEYLFPTFQDAKHVINQIHDDCVNRYGGVKLNANPNGR